MKKYLTEFINHENIYSEMFNIKSVDVNALTDLDAQNIFDKLLNKLNPENLSCDGELSREKITQRRKFFIRAYRELESLGFKNVNAIN